MKMRAEVSALFHLRQARVPPVENAHIGSGVFIQAIEPEWLDAVKTLCPKVAAREQVEYLKPYTHRLFYEGRGAGGNIRALESTHE